MSADKVVERMLKAKGYTEDPEVPSDTKILNWIEEGSDDACCIVENWVENGGALREACIAAMQQ